MIFDRLLVSSWLIPPPPIVYQYASGCFLISQQSTLCLVWTQHRVETNNSVSNTFMSEKDKGVWPKAVNLVHVSEVAGAFALEAVKKYGLNNKYDPEDLKNDRYIVLEAVKKDASNLQYASEDLIRSQERQRNSPRGVFEAVKQDWWNLEYATDRLKKNKIFSSRQSSRKEELFVMRRIISRTTEKLLSRRRSRMGLLFSMRVSNNIKNDRDIFLEAVKWNGFALRQAFDNHTKDKECILEAVKQKNAAKHVYVEPSPNLSLCCNKRHG